MADELRLDAAFQARHLAVPMTQAFTVRLQDPAGTARTNLRDRRFDQAPVVDETGPVGFVLTKWLDEGSTLPVSSFARALGSGNLVSADASVGRLLEWIIDPGFLFVLEGRDITGFIAVSDFNKQPVRAYLYLLLARLETGLADLIRKRFPDQRDALSLLPPDGQQYVLARYRPDEHADAEGEMVAYFDFSDLVEIVGQDDVLRQMIAGRSRNSWAQRAGGLVALRNQVMHPVRNMVLSKGGLVQLQKREMRIRALIEKAETAVERITL